MAASRKYSIEFAEYRLKLDEIRGFKVADFEIVKTAENIKLDDRFTWRHQPRANSRIVYDF